MTELRVAWDEALKGRGGALLLSGEAGIGKTRLAEEGAALAQDRGALCTWGRAWESGGAPAFWPWSQIVRGLEGAGEELGVPLPTLLTSLLPGGRPNQDGTSRFELFDALGVWLSSLSKRQPLWLCLEDLHAADAASLALLEALLTPLRTARVLLVTTVRDTAIAPSDSALFRRIARQARQVPVGPLAEPAARTLLETAFAAAPASVLGAALEATSGHPLFLVEFVRLARSSGALRPEMIPTSVQRVLRDRLDAVDESTRDVLTCAAVVGMDLDRALLERLCGLERVERALRQAATCALLRDQGGRSARFVHALLRDVLLERLGPDELAAAHGQVADALEALTTSAATRAHHLHQAGPTRRAEALAASFEAASDSLQRFAFEDALAHVAVARPHLTAHAPPALQARFAILEGRALLGLGQNTAGLQACRWAADIARRAEEPELLAEAALAHGSLFHFGAVDPKLVALLEAALEALPAEDGPLRAQVLARLAAARQPDPDPEDPMTLAREAIAMAERLGGADVRVAVLRSACSTLVDLAPPSERRELDERHLELALGQGLFADVLTARLRLLFDCFELGELESAFAHVREVRNLALTGGPPKERWRVPALEVLERLWRGELSETRELIERARELGDTCGDPNARLSYLFQLGRYLELSGDTEGVEEVARDLGRLFSQSGTGEAMAAVLRARFLLQVGRVAEGVAALTPAHAAAALQMGDRTLLQCLSLWAAAAQNAQLGRILLDRLRTETDWFVADGVLALVFREPVTLLLSRAAEATGELVEALAWAETAARMAQQVGSAPAAAEAHLLAARLAHQLGRSAVASGHTSRAREHIERLGLRGLGGRLLSEGDTPRERPRSESKRAEHAPPPAHPPSCHTEGDVYRLTWRGRSVRVKATKGLAVIDHLLARPGVPVDVLELVHLAPGAGTPGGPTDRSDGGELLDAQARSAYRARLREVALALEEAEQDQDRARIEPLRAELEFLQEELERATGLGGRSRRAPDAGERARQAVRKRIRTGLDHIGELYPELARYLERAIATGRTCIFQP
jgi:tetratricopeptide (TPR) repeat protein